MQVGFSQAIPDLYLGLTPPCETPEVFAPGIVSLPSRNDRVITFSPQGHEIFFAIGNWPTRTTLYIQYIDDTWTSPVTATFNYPLSRRSILFDEWGACILLCLPS